MALSTSAEYTVDRDGDSERDDQRYRHVPRTTNRRGIQNSSACLRFWTKILLRRGTMIAIIGVMSTFTPLGCISTRV